MGIWDKHRKQRTKVISDNQEKRVAKYMNGKVRPGSGSSMYSKGDVICDSLLIECKVTDKKSLSIKASWLEKITNEAMVEEKDPALVFSMNFQNNIVEQDWIALPVSVFNRLTTKGD